MLTYPPEKRIMRRRSTWRNFNKPYVEGHSAYWMISGQEYFKKIVELIDQASDEIHLQTYIFIDDKTGRYVGEALLRAVQRNVRVFILIDAFGSDKMSKGYEKSLEEGGIVIRRFGKFYSRGSFHIGRRLHRKVLVIDGSTAVVGGINIADYYAGTPQKAAWLDFAIIVNGAICKKIELICRRRWDEFKFEKNAKKTQKQAFQFSNLPIRVRRNDFIRNQNEIAITYRQAIRRAKTSLIFVGGYFLPGGRTRRLLRSAVRRGVEVSVLVAEKSDVGLMVNARRYLYSWLTENGIRVFEYRPANVHGKVVVVDKKWTSIGSYDLNNLSTYSNIELNIDVNDQKFSENIAAFIQNTFDTESTEVTIQSTLLMKTIFSTIKCWLSYQFVKTFFVLSFLLAGKQRSEEKK